MAGSALWMTLFYVRQPGAGVLAYLFRLAFGSGMVVAEYVIRRPARGRTITPVAKVIAKASS